MSTEQPGATLELHGSRIVTGAGLLDRCGTEIHAVLPGRRLVIISDDTVAPLYADRVAAACTAVDGPARVMLRTVPAGETSKSRAQWARLTDELLDAGVGRDAAVVALGGGVVGDLAGFVAATFMRGIPFVQLPTTLLAMIDASIGGKTGVDTRAGKNLVGAFHHPALVIADPLVLATLPMAELRNGLAEAVKHGVIASAADFEWTGRMIPEILDDGGPVAAAAERLVRRNIEIKAAIVRRDAQEHGVRKLLNFGHTIGHAIESLSAFTLPHGACVAIGMVTEATIAARTGIAGRDLAGIIAHQLRSAGLPTTVPASLVPRAVLEATRSDKKSRGGSVQYALPVGVGEMCPASTGFAVPVPDAVILEAIAECQSNL